MLEQLNKSSERSIKTRAQVFVKLKEALIAHSKAEEKIFYSSINRADANSLVSEAKHEHHEVERLLMEMEKIDFSSPEWMSMLKELKKNNEHHVKEEESLIFKQAHKIMRH